MKNIDVVFCTVCFCFVFIGGDLCYAEYQRLEPERPIRSAHTQENSGAAGLKRIELKRPVRASYERDPVRIKEVQVVINDKRDTKFYDSNTIYRNDITAQHAVFTDAKWCVEVDLKLIDPIRTTDLPVTVHGYDKHKKPVISLSEYYVYGKDNRGEVGLMPSSSGFEMDDNKKIRLLFPMPNNLYDHGASRPKYLIAEALYKGVKYFGCNRRDITPSDFGLL